MPKFQVIVSDFITPPLAPEEAVLGDIADLYSLDARCEADLQGRIEEADALLVYHLITLGQETLSRLKRCRVIVRCGVGYDNIDVAAARERGIVVCNVPDYGTEEVADTAIGMMLTMMRGIHYLNSRTQRKAGAWSYEQVIPIHRLRQQVFGVIGLGRIGFATALRAKAFGMQVVFYDPYVADGYDKTLGIQRADTLEELLKLANVVSVHCYRSLETQHMINAETLALMKQGAYLVNTARGGIVDASAVLRAIEAGHLRGAALDVLEVEPPKDDDPLIRAWRDPSHPAYDRLILNPHSAFYSEEGKEDMRIKGSQSCRRVLLGETPRNVVN